MPEPHRHHRVLQRDPLARVRVDVAGGHARHPEPLGQLREQPVAAPVVAPEGPLELDPEAVGPEGAQQAPRDRGRARMVAAPRSRAATAPSPAQPDRQTSPSA